MKKIFFIFCLIFFFTSQVTALDKVVVIPLLGDCDTATGIALEKDVRKGRTFSNQWSTGLTGTRPPAPVEKTGQASARATGDDGDLKKGIHWPVPRYTARVNVVTDNLTGLMWQKEPANGVDEGDWSSAIDFCNALMIWEPAGQFSILYDDWRLPNINELLSLVDRGSINPALPPLDPFINVLSEGYWSSTAYVTNSDDFWVVDFTDGSVNYYDDNIPQRVWCVIGGYTGF